MEHYSNELTSTLASLSWTQWVALFTGIIYVILAAREKIICWVFGIISCGFIAFDDFTDYRLYADGVLQLFYVIMGFVGLYHWARPGNKEVSLTISTITGKAHLGILILGLMLSIPVGYFLRLYSNAAFSYMDSITTVFSIIATVLLIQKKLENWIYWIVIDVVYCYLFFQREGYLISLLYGIYLIVAVYGYRQWSAKMKY